MSSRNAPERAATASHVTKPASPPLLQVRPGVASDVRVVVSDLEQEIALNVARKQDTHSTITNELAARNRVAS